MDQTTAPHLNRRHGYGYGCLIVAVSGIAVLFVIIAAVSLTVTPLANAAIRRELRRRGVDSAVVEVQHVGIHSMLVGPVRLGPEDALMSADLIRVEYRWPQLLRGRFTAVDIIGLRVHAQQGEDSGWTIGGLDDIRALMPGPDRSAAGPAATLPDIQTMRLRSARLIVQPLNRVPRHIIVNATGMLAADGTFEAAIDGVDCDAAVAVRGRGQWQAGRLRMDGQGTLRLGRLPQLPGRAVIEDMPSTFDVHLRTEMGHPAAWRAVLSLQPEGQTLRVRFPDVAIDTEVQAAVEIRGDRHGARIGIGATAVAPTAVAEGGTFGFEDVRFSAHGALPHAAQHGADNRDDPFRLRGRVSADGGWGTFGTQADVSGLSVDLPFIWEPGGGIIAPEAAEPCTWVFGTARVAGFELTGIETKCRLTADGLVFEGLLRTAAPEAEMQIVQQVILQPEPKLTTHITVPTVAVAARDAWMRRFPALRGIGIDGNAGASAVLMLDRDGFRGYIECILEGVDVTFSGRSSVESLRGALLIRLPGLDTPMHQKLAFEGGAVEGIPFGRGRLQLTGHLPESLFIEAAQVEWCGGLLRTHAVQVDFDDVVFDAVVYAENIELEQVVSLLKGFEGSAQGTLYGQLPVFIRNGQVRYRDGFLYNVPGRPGVLKLKDVQLLTEGVAGTREAYGNLQLAEKALRDLQFSLFKMDFAGDGMSDTRLTIQVAGDSRADRTLPPVSLTVNVTGALDEYINLGLELGGGHYGGPGRH